MSVATCCISACCSKGSGEDKKKNHRWLKTSEKNNLFLLTSPNERCCFHLKRTNFNIVWGCTYRSHLHNIFLVQKTMVRISSSNWAAALKVLPKDAIWMEINGRPMVYPLGFFHSLHIHFYLFNSWLWCMLGSLYSDITCRSLWKYCEKGAGSRRQPLRQ